MRLSPTHVSSTTDVVHGVSITDPYRWLEERTSVATEDWVVDQQSRCETYFSGVVSLVPLRDRVKSYLNIDCVDQPAIVGSNFFYRRRQKNQEQPCICVRNLAEGSERVLFDPSNRGPFASGGIYRIAADGSLLAIEVKHGGTGSKEIHIVDCNSGELLHGHLPRGYGRGLAFAPDRSGFYYCHETSQSGEHTIRFHRFTDEATSEDSVVFRVERIQGSRLVLIADQITLGAVFIRGVDTEFHIDCWFTRHPQDRQWVPLFMDKQAPYAPFFHRGRLFVLTTESAPNGRIVELNERGQILREAVLETSTPIQGFVPVGDTIHVSYFKTHTFVIRNWSLDGIHTGDLCVPDNTSIRLQPSLSDGAEGFFYTCESFVTRPTLYQYSPHNPTPIKLASQDNTESPISSHTMTVEYGSTDDTLIPMSLVMRRDLDLRAPRPVIMTAYGGFGVPIAPQFSVLVTIMIDLGAIFALPNIRGGSEYGRSCPFGKAA